MDQATKERLQEEARQRSFVDLLERAGGEKNPAGGQEIKDEVMKIMPNPEAGTVKGLVEHIFNRATSEPAAVIPLADLCSLMPTHFDPPEVTSTAKERGAGSRGSSEKRIDFRLMVLKKCKDELEKGAAAMKACKVWDAKEHQGKGGKGGGLKGEEKEQAELDRAAHTRMLAAVTFCGCLYNVGILTEKIIHSAIEALLKDESQGHENMEILAKLLRNIGGKLDQTSRSSKDGKAVAEYFKRIEKIKEEANSKDIAKMMESVLTLRENNWQAVA